MEKKSLMIQTNTDGQTFNKQECIQVGCVPQAAAAISPAMHACPLPHMSPCHACPPVMHASPAMHAPCHAHPYHACPLPCMPLPCMPPMPHKPPPCHVHPLACMPPATHAPPWTEWQTSVKTLPCRHFAAGGNKKWNEMKWNRCKIMLLFARVGYEASGKLRACGFLQRQV